MLLCGCADVAVLMLCCFHHDDADVAVLVLLCGCADAVMDKY
jgi:hypothetical protein